MLPAKSIEQFKKLRKEVQGKDINDLVDKEETKLPNLYWMDNPIDGGRIQSYEDFTKKDNKLQTTAFKSKLVNKPISENLNNEMETSFNSQDFYILQRVLPYVEPCDEWGQEDIDSLNAKVDKMAYEFVEQRIKQEKTK